MKQLLFTLSCALLTGLAPAHSAPPAPEGAPTAHLTCYGAGAGPRSTGGTYRVLDSEGTFDQSNAVAFDREALGARMTTTLQCRLRVLEGGDGGAFLFLNTAEYGARGPSPFVRSWVEPQLAKSLAVGIDVHDPFNEEPFSEWGNYQDLPEREISLHWDGRELVKRTVDTEFRGDWADLEIRIVAVCGGSEVSVRIGESLVYDRYFVAELVPYESRLAFGAGTRADLATEFDVAEVELKYGEPASPVRPPLHVDVFNHVLTNNSKTSYEAEVELPPLEWAFGRIILTLEIHDAGKDWDEWDRNGHLSIWDPEGNKWDIVPFITSYRTECHWKVDVTHFRPWLTGKTRFEVAAGTTFYKNRGYMMSVTLDYHHGEPVFADRELEPYHVEPLWVGTARYKSAENHFADFFAPLEVEIPAETEAARVLNLTTGHSQVGEFTPSRRTLVFAADKEAESAEQRFDNKLWKTDCFLNPNRPQYGTWKYARAGWAPGDVVRPWWVDLTPHLAPGKTAGFRYEPQPYVVAELQNGARTKQEELNKANHVVRSYLILYREQGTASPAPILRVASVTGGSSAAKAGIKTGDYLSSYNDAQIDSLEDLIAAKQAAEDAGKALVPVVVYRGTERLELEMAAGRMGVTLGTR